MHKPQNNVVILEKGGKLELSVLCSHSSPQAPAGQAAPVKGAQPLALTAVSETPPNGIFLLGTFLFVPLVSKRKVEHRLGCL